MCAALVLVASGGQHESLKLLGGLLTFGGKDESGYPAAVLGGPLEAIVFLGSCKSSKASLLVVPIASFIYFEMLNFRDSA